MKTDQGPKEEPPPSFVPSEDWIDALEEQCTAQMFQRAQRYAARRARGLDKAGHSTDDYYVRELVQDALTDTTIGVLHWEPSAKSLERHIKDVIKVRTNHDRKHARKFPHESLDALTPDGESATMDEVDAAHLANGPGADTVALAAEVTVQLRQLAAGDPPVLRLLDAFASGATTRDDAMHVAELSRMAYHNARRRLARLVAQLSIHGRPSRHILAKGA